MNNQESKLYRLYIDESGTHHYSISDDIKRRYLSLTGVIVERNIYANNFQKRVGEIKKLFSKDPDNPPILHREDIVNKQSRTWLNIKNLRNTLIIIASKQCLKDICTFLR